MSPAEMAVAFAESLPGDGRSDEPEGWGLWPDVIVAVDHEDGAALARPSRQSPGVGEANPTGWAKEHYVEGVEKSGGDGRPLLSGLGDDGEPAEVDPEFGGGDESELRKPDRTRPRPLLRRRHREGEGERRGAPPSTDADHAPSRHAAVREQPCEGGHHR
jgi:hypothetical protein